jgi:hypothetical protein
VALERGKAQPIHEDFGNSDQFNGLVRRYLEALRTGRFPAPSSEPIVARTALHKLGDFMASDGRAGVRPEP